MAVAGGAAVFSAGSDLSGDLLVSDSTLENLPEMKTGRWCCGSGDDEEEEEGLDWDEHEERARRGEQELFYRILSNLDTLAPTGQAAGASRA